MNVIHRVEDGHENPKYCKKSIRGFGRWMRTKFNRKPTINGAVLAAGDLTERFGSISLPEYCVGMVYLMIRIWT
jgi:hypothetical protein